MFEGMRKSIFCILIVEKEVLYMFLALFVKNVTFVYLTLKLTFDLEEDL